MSYHAVPPKPDNPAENKFFFLCQTRGCGEVINPAFPVADRNPSPKYCKNCQVKEVRVAIEHEFDAHLAPVAA
jgi:hypothetical protein